MTGAVRRWILFDSNGIVGDYLMREKPSYTRKDSDTYWQEVEIRPVQAGREEQVGNAPTRYWLSDDGKCLAFKAVHPGLGWTELFPWKEPPPAAGMKRGRFFEGNDGGLRTLTFSPYEEPAVGLVGKVIEYRVISDTNPTPTPARCVCGAEVECHEFPKDMEFRVSCDADSCWAGPARSTRDEAVSAWNAMMERKT